MKTFVIDNSELREILDQIAGPKSAARGLPNAAYTDAEFFELERDHVIGGSWAAIGYAGDVPEPGFANPVDFMGLPLLVVRNRQDEIRVFHNVCSHRGMLLVGSTERFHNVIRCPYHSWAYDFDGLLVSTPHIGGFDVHSCVGFDKDKHGLKTVRFSVWMDIIFVNLSGDAEPFEDYIAPLEARWSKFLNDRDRPDIRPASDGSHLELNVNCNWKLAVENYCEAYHLPWVHPDLNSYSPLDQHFNIADNNAFSGQGTHHYDLASTAGTQLPVMPGWPKDKQNVAEYISLYPNVLLAAQADHFFSVIVIPRHEGLSTEKLQISYYGAAASDAVYESCRNVVLKSWDKVFREDIFAVEGMQNGRESSGFSGGILTPVQDVPTRHFHTWVADQYATAIRSANEIPCNDR